MIPSKMKALAILEPGKAQVVEVTTPAPQPGEILIKIERCLLCTWEQRMYRNGAGAALPMIPGHEISGNVAAVPEDTVTSFKVGDRVVAKTLDSCGHCEYCYSGDDNNCVGVSKKRVYDGIPSSGGLAQFIALPVSRVYLLPDQKVDLDIAAFAEPVACCIRSLDRADLALGEDAVIVGAGIMGQLHNLLAKLRGGRTIVVDLDAERLALAKQMGADEVVNPNEGDPYARIRELTLGMGAHAIFYTLQSPKLAQEYLQSLRKLGRMVYYGSFSPKDPIQVDPNKIHYSEQVITGSYSPTSKGFYTAARLLSYGLIDVAPFLSGVYPLSEADAALERSMAPDTFRVGIDLWR